MTESIDLLHEHARTDNDKAVLDAYINSGYSSDRAAVALGKDGGSVRKVIRKLKTRAAQSPKLSGTSTLIRHKHREDSSTGKILEWIKTRVDYKQQSDAAIQMIESLISDIEPLPLIKYENKARKKDCFTCIPLGDPHIGLLTWSKEVGEDWDVTIAQRVYRNVFTRLLSKCPDTEVCVLVNTGDFFHADNIQGTTSRSGHRLDLDGRHGKWLDAGFSILRMFIDACLKKYKEVHFINVAGNHDDILGRALGSYTHQLYLNNRRCIISKGDNPFQYFHKGEVLLGFAHGHTCKLPSLVGKMADDQAALWGKTTLRHWITGHVHHRSWMQFKEHSGASVETVGIIPPKDAYAHGGGYGAGRGVQAIVYNYKTALEDSRYGEKVLGSD